MTEIYFDFSFIELEITELFDLKFDCNLALLLFEFKIGVFILALFIEYIHKSLVRILSGLRDSNTLELFSSSLTEDSSLLSIGANLLLFLFPL